MRSLHVNNALVHCNSESDSVSSISPDFEKTCSTVAHPVYNISETALDTHVEKTFLAVFLPAKAREYVFTGVGLCVCLSVCLCVCL